MFFFVIIWRVDWCWAHLWLPPHQPVPPTFLQVWQWPIETCSLSKNASLWACLDLEESHSCPGIIFFAMFSIYLQVHIHTDLLWCIDAEEASRQASKGTAVQTNKLAASLLSCSTGTMLKLLGFPQRQTQALDQPLELSCCIYTVQTCSFRPAPSPASWKQYPEYWPTAKQT